MAGSTEKVIRLAGDSGVVIGIDPGSQRMGWGVVREKSGVLEFLACGVIRPGVKDFSARLGIIFKELRGVLRQYQPDEAAIENVFTQKNALTALKLGQARGIAVGACASLDILVADYEPALIKKTLTGNGRAEKSQVSFMVARMLGMKESWGEDAGDALATAICHLNIRRLNRFLC
ncbi:MAG: crossover junction endodeoxyribonuclease RuvC [Deltaproteobacteria bacterium]|jgi:crossover junction endodeoxyribonuclease RuvC|nr:crossover junction endodeoxyribonuclease RuvC [Deltaproteobacteria bacterium]